MSLRTIIMTFDILIFDGFDELDALAPFEVLQNAKSAGVTARLVSMGGTEEIVAAHGLRVRPSARLDLADRPKAVIVPGGGWLDGSPKGARAEADRGEIPKALQALHESGITLASVCTGAMLLAAAGILRGRPATTHHGAVPDLQNAGAEFVRARVVDDGEVVTAAGVTAGLDLGLWLVERFCGSKAACEIEAEMEYKRQGTVWRRTG